MSSIINSDNERTRPGVTKRKKHLPRIDMTPMVDLGFLLITFFVLTAQLNEPTSMNLYMPKDGEPTDLCESCAMTLLIENNTYYYYPGQWRSAVANGEVKHIYLTGPGGLREIIQQKKKELDANPLVKNGSNDMMLLIKAGKNASYREVVDAMDEATINMVKKYALIKLSPDEKTWLKTN